MEKLRRNDSEKELFHKGSTNNKFSVGPTEIHPSEIERFEVLGEGSFGVVYRGKCRQKDVAVKVLLEQNLDEKTLIAFRHEVELMSKIFHPNMNLFMGACTVPGNLMIVTELMRSDVQQLLESNTQISLLTRMRMAKDAALGVLWLHSSNPQIIHRDLKASNLLVDENLTCKICDFGLSQVKARGKNLVDPKDEGAKGTPIWMSPEVLMGEEFNEKTDVYSFGLILWFFLTRKEPFVDDFNSLEEFSVAVCYHHVRPKIPEGCHPSLKELIQRCWHPHQNCRIDFNEIVTRLKHIIVECAIQDPIGSEFWKYCFLEKDSVPWNDFLDSLDQNIFRLTPSKLNHFPLSDILANQRDLVKDTNIPLLVSCLKALIVKEGSEDVSMEKFGEFLNWFGPLEIGSQAILHRVKETLQNPWFHGDISTRESENLLFNKPGGTFLVRFSTSSPGCFTISKVSQTDGHTIKHQKILQHQGRFQINEREYSSLVDLIKGEKNALGLLSSCTGSKYLYLFQESQTPFYHGYIC